MAMVLAAEGEVSFIRPSGETRTARVMDILFEGDKLAVGNGKRLQIVLLHDGRRATIKPGFQVVIRNRSWEPVDGADVEEPPERARQAVVAGLKELSRNHGASTIELRGDSGTFPAIVPLADTCVLSNRPKFHWPAVAGAQRYEIVLWRSASKEIVFRRESNTNHLDFPEQVASLARDRRYNWSCSAWVGEVQSVQNWNGNFLVASEADQAELKSLEPLSNSSEPSDWLLAAAAYESFQAHEEALALFDRLVEALPKTGSLHAARAWYLQRAGRITEAERARAAARENGYVFPRAPASAEKHTSP
jgi:hypothetical protein